MPDEIPIPTLPPFGLIKKGYIVLKSLLSVDCSHDLPPVLIPKSKIADAFELLAILNLVPVLTVVPVVAGFDVAPPPLTSNIVEGVVIPNPKNPLGFNVILVDKLSPVLRT